MGSAMAYVATHILKPTETITTTATLTVVNPMLMSTIATQTHASLIRVREHLVDASSSPSTFNLARRRAPFPPTTEAVS